MGRGILGPARRGRHRGCALPARRRCPSQRDSSACRVDLPADDRGDRRGRVLCSSFTFGMWCVCRVENGKAQRKGKPYPSVTARTLRTFSGARGTLGLRPLVAPPRPRACAASRAPGPHPVVHQIELAQSYVSAVPPNEHIQRWQAVAGRRFCRVRKCWRGRVEASPCPAGPSERHRRPRGSVRAKALLPT